MVSTIAGGHHTGISMARVRRRRRYWSDESKRRIVAEIGAAGVSVSEVARRHDVNANLVFKWLRDPRFMACETGSGFLPVHVVDRAEARCVEGPSDGRIEIALGNGHRLSIVGGFDADAVCRVLRLLGGLS